jgi:hypothetical protein
MNMKISLGLVSPRQRDGSLVRSRCAIDGSNFKAVNNRDRHFTSGKIASRLAHLEASVERYIDEMVRIGRQEESEVRAEKVANIGRRYGRIQSEIRRLRSLKEVPDEQISLTDTGARAMATSARHSGLVGYNAQPSVDTETEGNPEFTLPQRTNGDNSSVR